MKVRRGDGVVVGVDIGTTSTKVIAYDASGRPRAAAEHGYPLDQPVPGQAVQDPERVVAAVLAGLAQVAGLLAGQGVPIAGVSFSSAMHSLMAVGRDGAAASPLVTWADLRAIDQAQRLRSGMAGPELHRRTGTPVHPMAPLPKLIWFREQQPEIFAGAHRWLGIKDFVLARLSGQYLTDVSTASGTGLLELDSGQWWPYALELAGISAGQLPPVHPAGEVIALRASMAGQLGLADVPLVIGAGDGPLANVGVGATRPGVAACSIGTSGALRVMVEAPGVDAQGRVFCYALSTHRWCVGGAISNGGSVLDWAGDALAPELVPGTAGAGTPRAGTPGAGTPGAGKDALVALAAQAPPGSEGLVMLPYLLSERAPHWDGLARGAYVGLTRAHRRPHLIRAALEGVCQQLALVLHAVRAAGNQVVEIRATGGFLREPFTRQLLVDVLGRPVHFASATGGSAFGAAFLGMDALGMIESIDRAADLVVIEETLEPDPAAAELYQDQRQVFDDLYDALGPAFAALRRHTPTSSPVSPVNAVSPISPD